MEVQDKYRGITYTPNVDAVLSGLKYWFCGLGYQVSKTDDKYLIICAHMCGGYDDDSTNEQKAKVDEMIQDSIERSGIKDVTFTSKLAPTFEHRGMHHFYVEILVP